MAKQKIGRNETCPCGSGKKYKKCCLTKDEQENRELRKTPEQENEELYEDLPPQGSEFEDEYIQEYDEDDDWLSDEDESFFDDMENSGDDSFFEDESSEEDMDEDDLPELSEEETDIIDTWHEDYFKLEDVDEKIESINTFMDAYPLLVDGLELHMDILFELGSDLVKLNRHGDYIKLLLRFRKEFPESYEQSHGYYDHDIICYLIMTDRMEDIDTYLNYYKDGNGYRPDHMHSVLDMILLTGDHGIFTEFANNVLNYIDEIYGNEIFLSNPLVFANAIPFLKPDITKSEAEQLVMILNDKKIIDCDLCDTPVESVENQIKNLFVKSKKWEISSCKSSDDIERIYLELSGNFMGYLHKQKELTWSVAFFLRKNLMRYLMNSIPAGKRPKELAVLTKNRIDTTMVRSCKDVLWINSPCSFGMLNGLWYFADYMRDTGINGDERTNRIQGWVKDLYDQLWEMEGLQSFESKLFETFPMKR